MFYYGSFVFVARRDQPKSAEKFVGTFFSFLAKLLLQVGQGQHLTCHRVDAARTSANCASKLFWFVRARKKSIYACLLRTTYPCFDFSELLRTINKGRKNEGEK